MKKTFAALICLAAALGIMPAARAVSLGKYQWGSLTLDCVEVKSDSVIALEGLQPDEQAALVCFQVSDGLWVSRGRLRALYGQLCLEGKDGTLYSARAAIRSSSEPLLSFIFAVPMNVPLDSLALSLPPDGSESLPEGLAGDWIGVTGGISLRLTVNPDGSGSCMFVEQSGNERFYDVSFYLDGAAFMADIFKGDALGITCCEGTYACADGALTLDVKTDYEDGRRVEYSIPFVRDVKGNGPAPEEELQGEDDTLLFAGEWQGQDDTLRYVFTFQADGGFAGLGYRIGETDAAFSNQGTWQAIGNELRIMYDNQAVVKADYKITPEGLELTTGDKTLLLVKVN
jgi:hypothetical protein